MGREAGLDYVQVRKSELIETLTANRGKHRAVFEDAMEGYKAKAIEVLTETLEAVKVGQPKRVYLTMPIPEDHTDDYDRAIEMLQWSVDDHVWLAQHEFEQYVRDQWGWAAAFAETTAMYASSR